MGIWDELPPEPALPAVDIIGLAPALIEPERHIKQVLGPVEVDYVHEICRVIAFLCKSVCLKIPILAYFLFSFCVLIPL